MLVVKRTHTEILLLSESLETKAKLKKIAKQDTKKNFKHLHWIRNLEQQLNHHLHARWQKKLM